MMLDKATLERILKLPDDQLLLIIKGLAKESGVDISNINIGKAQLDAIRSALSTATPQDIERAGEIVRGFKGNKQQ